MRYIWFNYKYIVEGNTREGNRTRNEVMRQDLKINFCWYQAVNRVSTINSRKRFKTQKIGYALSLWHYDEQGFYNILLQIVKYLLALLLFWTLVLPKPRTPSFVRVRNVLWHFSHFWFKIIFSVMFFCYGIFGCYVVIIS